MAKPRAPQNRTLTLAPDERDQFQQRLLRLTEPVALETVLDRTVCQDALAVLPLLPPQSIDLVFADPPYNLSKVYNQHRFNQRPDDAYLAWLEQWIALLPRLLKANASVYVCSEWRSSHLVRQVLAKHFIIRNRITWEREKGRAAKHNWKNAAEDIWFCTVSDTYTFNQEAVKLKRQVLAPYTSNGQPKDWGTTKEGRYRLTAPSNLWTDLTVPFWSMPENTDHPTQKPEKLLAKIILASTNPKDVVLDPFLGSGTTSVVARKAGRHFIGIEQDETYACLSEKRLALARNNTRIQGYEGGVFWERNTSPKRRG